VSSYLTFCELIIRHDLFKFFFKESLKQHFVFASGVIRPSTSMSKFLNNEHHDPKLQSTLLSRHITRLDRTFLLKKNDVPYLSRQVIFLKEGNVLHFGDSSL
jgi:hypothetical protein